MAITEDLLVRIRVQNDKGGKAVDKMKQKLDGFSKSTGTANRALKGLDASLDVLVGGFNKFERSVIAGNQALEIGRKIVFGFQQSFAATVGTFAEFEQGLVSVGKTTNIAGDELVMFGDQIEGLSNTIPVARSELLEIATVAGQLGVNGTNNLLKFTDTIARLGVATDLNGEEAAQTLARILSVTGQGVGVIDRFGSVLTILGNNFATTERQIAKATNEISRSLAIFGVQAQESAAFATTISALGVRAELSGSAIGRAFREISSAINKGGAALDVLSRRTGKSADQLRENFAEDAAGTVINFFESLQDIRDPARLLDELDQLGLKGDEVARTLPPLIKRIDEVKRAYALATQEFKDNTALLEESRRAFGTTQGDLRLLSNSVLNLGAALGEVLSPIIRPIIRGLAGIFIAARELVVILRDIDFEPFFVGTIAVMGFFAAFKLGPILGAVAAIANLNSVMAVLAGRVAFFQAFASIFPMASVIMSSAAAMGVFAAKAAVASVGVLGLVAAIDLLLKNLTKLPQLFSLIVPIIFEGINELLKGVNSLSQSFIKLFGLKSDILQDSLKLLEHNSRRVAIRFEELREGIDSGFGGDVLDAIESFGDKLGNFDVKIKEAIDSVIGLDAAEADLEQQTALAQQKIELLNAALETLNLKSQLDLVGAGQITQLEIQRDLALDQLEAKRAQLEIEGKLASNPALAAQLEIQEALIRQTAAKRMSFALEEAQRSAIEDNLRLQNQINGIGLTGVAQIKQRLDTQILELDLQADKLRREEQLTDEMQKQLDIREGLLREGAQRQIEQSLRVDVISDSQLDQVGNVFGEGVSGALGAARSAIGSSFAGPIAAAQGVVNAAQGVVNAIPNLFNSVADLIGSITNLPQAIFESFNRILDSLVTFITDFIPNLISAIEGILMEIVNFILEVPEAIAGLAERLPELIEGFVDRVPEIVQKLVAGLIVAGPKISIAMAKMLIVEAPKIAFEIVRVMVMEIPRAIFEGIQQAFSGDNISLFSEQAFAKGIEQLKDAGTGLSNQLFSVQEFGQKKNAQNNAKEIEGAFVRGSNLLNHWAGAIKKFFMQDLPKIWQGLLSGLEQMWLDLRDLFAGIPAFFDKVWIGLKEAFAFIPEFTAGFIDAMGEMWVTFRDLFAGIPAFFDKVWIGLKEALGFIPEFFEGFFSTLGEMFSNILSPITRLIDIGFDSIDLSFDPKEIGKKLGDAAKAPFNVIFKAFDALKIPKTTIIPGTRFTDEVAIPAIDLIPGTLAFNEGGFVPGGFDPSNLDNVLARLTPGEFVINRPAAQALGPNVLGSLNRGQMPGSSGNITIDNQTITINTTEKVDQDFIRRRLIPEMKKSLKEASQRGEFVISNKGVRS